MGYRNHIQEVMGVKVKVVKRFVDRITKEMRYAGKEYEYSDERAKELADGGYVDLLDGGILQMPKAAELSKEPEQS